MLLVTRLVLLTTVLALAAAAAATASTPEQYRANVNALCRSYTPKMRQLNAQMEKAQAANNAHAYGVALGKYLLLGLDQDLHVEAVPVPAALTPTMKPILARLKLVDAQVRTTLRVAGHVSDAQFAVQLKKLIALTGPLDAWYDAAGLRDCGSAQA